MNKFQKAISLINETIERTVEDRKSSIALEYDNLSYDIDSLKAMLEILEVMEITLTEAHGSSESKLNEWYDKVIHEKFPKLLNKLFMKFKDAGQSESDYVEITRPRYDKIMERLRKI